MTVDIFDTVGEDFFGEGITAKSVARALENPDISSILVRINSPGGDVFEGNAIYSMLRAHKAHVRVEIHGLAASMASVIALAGDEVVMADNALFMVHNPWSVTVGDAPAMRKTADKLDKVTSTLASVYQARTRKSLSDILEMMDAETWLTAGEARAQGFVDNDPPNFEQARTKPGAQARAHAVLRRYTSTPDTAAAAYGTAETKTKPTMDRDTILALFGLPKEATPDTIRTRAAKLTAPPPTDTVPRADFDALNTELQSARAKLATSAVAEASRFSADVEAALDTACADGKIPPYARAYHKANASRDRASLAEFCSVMAQSPALVDDEQTKSMTGDGPTEGSSLTTEEAKICARLGVSPEVFIAQRDADKAQGPSATYGSAVG